MCCLLYTEDIGAGLVSKVLFEEMTAQNVVPATSGPDGTVTAGHLTGSGLELDVGGSVDLGNGMFTDRDGNVVPGDLSPTIEMTVCLWVTILHDHPGSWQVHKQCAGACDSREDFDRLLVIAGTF